MSLRVADVCFSEKTKTKQKQETKVLKHVESMNEHRSAFILSKMCRFSVFILCDCDSFSALRATKHGDTLQLTKGVGVQPAGQEVMTSVCFMGDRHFRLLRMTTNNSHVTAGWHQCLRLLTHARWFLSGLKFTVTLWKDFSICSWENLLLAHSALVTRITRMVHITVPKPNSPLRLSRIKADSKANETMQVKS